MHRQAPGFYGPLPPAYWLREGEGPLLDYSGAGRPYNLIGRIEYAPACIPCTANHRIVGPYYSKGRALRGG